MDHADIEREIFIEASPEIVFDVVSSPEHLRQWWPDDAEYEPTPGSNGRIVFGDPDAGGAVAGFAVIDAQPPRLFSFRWTQPVGDAAKVGNSLLVTFTLTSSAGGTRLRMTETGFQEMDWDATTLEAQYADHEHGWDYFLPRLAPYVARLAART
jgi:uncharacterized protein YndB with AHSA1/START domain